MLYPAVVLCVLLCVVLRPALLSSAVRAVLFMAGTAQQSIAQHGTCHALPCHATICYAVLYPAAVLCVLLYCACCSAVCAMLFMAGTAQQSLAQHGTSWCYLMP